MNPEDLTEQEVKESFEWFGIEPREADWQVLRMLSGEVEPGRGLGKITLETLSEYMWDHLMGEPDGTTADDVKDSLIRLLSRPNVEEVRKAYWALRAVGEFEVADKIASYGGLTEDERDHGEDLGQAWGVVL